jgi:hypothetical protein
MGNDWRVRVAVLAARSYYAKDGNGAGGVLHIMLDDGNLDASHVMFCVDEARKFHDTDAEAIAMMLVDMTRTQRGKVYSQYAHYAAA